ncbi:uncharacterized protein L3040_005989 [Drepanopeziza brunnea f. sp. 'multigermtubi']|uniref:uncharacterized protein n=1 Tax=Drepanopeziza brunnea f. sp. 'multigermtubi' TaxID=698441 RepID=UPI00238EB65D|nr:hypothetical protein L3040_005989 [Drepanopeziza brunnea f. sp. 'multigermtubi']
MEIHEEFTEWAVAQGIKINGIAAHKFEGRGLGIIATQKHEANTTLLTVPHSALIDISSVPKAITDALPPTKNTVHNILAAFLALDTSPSRAPWRAVLPDYASFKSSMPLCWPSTLQALLPPQAASLLAQQKKKLARDWAAATAAFPDLSYDRYLHAWLLVNTRTFYYVSPTASARAAPKNRDDCMALNPFADYFNHTSSRNACDVSFSPTGYTVTTSTSTPPLTRGAEIYISYGTHSNDFLLAEYGFIIPSSSSSSSPTIATTIVPSSDTNTDRQHQHQHQHHHDEDDYTLLDPALLPRLTPSQRRDLQEEGFLGNYTLDRAQGVCHRTQVALRIRCLPLGRWRRFVSGVDDGELDQPEVDALLRKVLEAYRRDVADKIRQVEGLEEGTAGMRDVLARRWRQIDGLLQSAIERIE